MDYTKQMAAELENMIDEVDEDIKDELTSVLEDLRTGKQGLNDYYRPSTPQKILSVFDEINQRIKR